MSKRDPNVPPTLEQRAQWHRENLDRLRAVGYTDEAIRALETLYPERAELHAICERYEALVKEHAEAETRWRLRTLEAFATEA